MAQLAREIAMNIRDRLADFGLTERDYTRIEQLDFYKPALDQMTIEWNSALSTNERIKLYSAAAIEKALPHRRAIRATNLLERLFGEERRRTKVIPYAFGERAVLKLIYAALIRAAERWRGLRMSEFERRQLIAIRNELDRAHAERTAPAVNANVTASPTRLSSKSRT